jgi:hypothetical protein
MVSAKQLYQCSKSHLVWGRTDSGCISFLPSQEFGEASIINSRKLGYCSSSGHTGDIQIQ